MARLPLVIDQIAFARRYTLRLLDSTDMADWFRMPAGGISHIAWQVGHLAVAQYRLALERVRGPQPADRELIPEEYLALFGRTTTPDADPANYPPAAAIRTVFDRVHEQVLRELPTLSEQDLDSPALRPHALVSTKLWSLLWCAQHEAVHAGQIGLLRRGLGYPPVW
jgi:hypothetical protein